MQDILQTAGGDLDLTSGDLRQASTDRATAQHKRDLLIAAPGDFKESPTLGVDAADYIQSDSEFFLRDVRRQMQADGMRVDRVAFESDGALVIDGGYDEND